MRVKSHHPLQELLAQLLFSIETVPPKEQRRMVNRACREAVKWHKVQIKDMQRWINDMERDIQAANGICPECHGRIGNYIKTYDLGGHLKDCALANMLTDSFELGKEKPE